MILQQACSPNPAQPCSSPALAAPAAMVFQEQCTVLEMLLPLGITVLWARSWSPVQILKPVAVVKGCALPLQLVEFVNTNVCSNYQHLGEVQLFFRRRLMRLQYIHADTCRQLDQDLEEF